MFERAHVTATHAAAKQSPLELVQDDLVSSMSDLYSGASLLYSAKFFTNKDNAMFVKDALENLYNITEVLADELDLDNPLMVDLEAAKKSVQGDASAGMRRTPH